MVKSSAHGLGRGFESLIPTELVDEEFDPTALQDAQLSKLLEISLEEISRDTEQPRENFDGDALDGLAASIKEHGVLQPIVVVKEDEGYKIVAGERRWRAAKLAGLEKIPAIVRTLGAQNRLELSVIENAQREDLSAIELATAYAKLKAQFNLTAKEIGERIGKSQSAITNTLRLLELPEPAKKAMREHRLTEGVMRPLLKLDEEEVEKILPRIIEEKWSARDTERYVAGKKKKSSVVAVKSDAFLKREGELERRWGAKVRVRSRSVTFSCKDEEELNALLSKLA